MATLGLLPTIGALGQPLDRLVGHDARSGRTVLDMRYAKWRGLGRGLGVHRSALFGVLHDAVVAERIEVVTGCTISGHEPGYLICGSRREGPFDLVVDALGATSPLRAMLPQARAPRPLNFGAIWGTVPWVDAGFERTALMQRYERASVMIGVLPVGRQSAGGPELASFFWSLRWREHEALVADGFESWRERVAGLWPETVPHLEALGSFDALSLARYQHYTAASPVTDGLVAVGDAAHSTSPQLGQGANMALLDARALTLALRMADVADALATYAWLRRWHVRLYQALSLWLTPAYQSESRVLPVLRDLAVPIAATMPPLPQLLAALVAGRLLDPFTALQLDAVQV